MDRDCGDFFELLKVSNVNDSVNVVDTINSQPQQDAPWKTRLLTTLHNEYISQQKQQTSAPPSDGESSYFGSSRSIDTLRTPCHIMYLPILLRNASKLQKIAKSKKNVTLRPHIKTHKTLQGSYIQTLGSCYQLSTSSLIEAQILLNNGFSNVLYSVPIRVDDGTLKQCATLTEMQINNSNDKEIKQDLNFEKDDNDLHISPFLVTVDHVSQIDALERHGLACKTKSFCWRVVVMIDCGYERDGIRFDDKRALSLIDRIIQSPVMAFEGLYTHGGHSYDIGKNMKPRKLFWKNSNTNNDNDTEEQQEIDLDYEKRVSSIRYVAEQERDAVLSLKHTIQNKYPGISPYMIGTGSTPTASHPPKDNMDGITELHPGNYLCYDIMQYHIGSICHLDDIACRVLTRVISHYPERNTLLIDCGWTGCSNQHGTEKEEYGYGLIEGYPELKINSLSQEVGIVGSIDEKNVKLNYDKYPIGTILKIIPYHACAVGNSHDTIHIISGSKLDQVVDQWECFRGW